MKKKLLALFLCCALSFGLVTAALITPAAADEDFLVYGSDGLVAHTVELAKNNKLALTAVASTGSGVYQWQIQVGGDVWANISGANGVTLDVSYALVANLLYGGAANLRCRLTAGEVVKYTNTVTVQITDETPVSAPAQAPKAPTVISEAEPVGEPVIIPPQTAVEETPAPDAAPAADAAPANDLTANVAPAALADPAPVNDPAPSDDGEEPYTQTFTITISYVDNKDQQVADPWTATVMAGSTYQSVIKSPVVVGYTAEQTEITVGGENIQADQNFTVKYTPAVVKFSVKHLLQNVSNDEYTQDGDPEIRNGNTGDEVGETLEKQYPGFYSLKYDATVKIAGDESTVVEVKYDRYYYLINFNLDGGYGVEPIYARYGAPVNVGNPQKPGYTFTGWSGEIPKTMPVIENPLSFTANWEKGTAGFTVVFWYENANDVGYSVAGTFTPVDVAPGTQKSSGDYQNQSFEGRDDKHFTYNTDKVETVTVKGDGSTVLNAPLQKIHLIQNLTNDEYTEYQSSTNLNATIGTDYSESPLTLTGFTYNEGKSTASGTLSADGLVLKLYYDRNAYPYEFRFLVQGTEKPIAGPVTGSARYQARVTQGAKEVPGYTLVLGTTNPQTIDIVTEEGNTAVNNVKIFYYVEDTVDIKYEAIGPEGCGTLDNYQNNTVKVIDGTPGGSTPTANAGFKFVGWFKDEACTEAADASWISADNKLTPGKTKNYGTEETPVLGYEAATYYAKFEADVANLTITKQGYEEIDGKQSFIFTVTGPEDFSKKIVIQGNGTVVLTGLKIGTYTVTEDTAWSWRYTPRGGAERTITLQAGKTNSVTYVNERTNNKWLDGNAYAKNVFGTIIETDSGN